MLTDQPALDYVKHWRLALPGARMIYDESETPKAFYRVERGCVRLQTTGMDGRRQILAFCLPGDFFGFEPGRTRMAAAETTIATELTVFPWSAIARLAEDPRCAPAVLGAACEMISSLTAHLRTFGHGSVEDHLMGFLEWLAERQGGAPAGVVQLPMSRRDIADFLGIANETLSRTIGRLEARGLIHVAVRREIVLHPASVRSPPLRRAGAPLG